MIVAWKVESKQEDKGVNGARIKAAYEEDDVIWSYRE